MTESTTVVREKVSQLVDLLKKKGDNAISKFVNHLKERDPEVCKSIPELAGYRSTGTRPGELRVYQRCFIYCSEAISVTC